MITYQITSNTRENCSKMGNPCKSFDLLDTIGIVMYNVKTMTDYGFVYGIDSLSATASDMFETRRYIVADTRVWRGKLRMTTGRNATAEEVATFKGQAAAHLESIAIASGCNEAPSKSVPRL